MHRHSARPARAGFTLLEILVALVLIGLVVGALVPTAVNQLGRGEVTRVADDLTTISTAAQAFRVDVGRYPGDLDDLVMALAAGGDADIHAAAYPAGLAARWAGPYLEVGGLRADNTLQTSFGASVVNGFSRTTWNGQGYLTVRVSGIAQADAEAVSRAVDGESLVAADGEQAGRVRWAAGDTLLFLAVPVR